MSYTYLLESGEESSADCYSDIPVSVLSRLSLTAEKSSCKDSVTESCQNSQSGTTCGLSTGDRGAGKSTVSVEASHAKTSPSLERARGLTESEAGCGASLRVLLARYDRDTRSWKTPQCSLFGDSDECLETFPKSGMMQNGLLWEQTMWARPTDANESGFWRTPDTGAGGTVSEKTLEEMANGNWTRKSGQSRQLRLQDQVRHPQLWPTPKCQDARVALFDRYKGNLGEVIHGRYLNGGNATPQTKSARLNPNWVEWLMGWPIGYTDSKQLATDKFLSWRQLLLTF